MIAILLALSCGIDMWPQKILADPGAAAALAPAPVASTIAKLGALPRTARRRAYVVEGVVAAIKTEADGDKHLIVSDGGHTMIWEAPNPRCAARSLAAAAIARAWRQVAQARIGDRVRAIGVYFADRCHGQSGAAPGCQELHPLLSITRIP